MGFMANGLHMWKQSLHATVSSEPKHIINESSELPITI